MRATCFVANPTIVDAVVKTPRRIFLMALKVGQTNAIFLDAARPSDRRPQHRRRFRRHRSRTRSFSAGCRIAKMLAPKPLTTMSCWAERSPIRSQPQQAGEAQDLAQSFAGSADKVVNTLNIDGRVSRS